MFRGNWIHYRDACKFLISAAKDLLCQTCQTRILVRFQIAKYRAQLLNECKTKVFNKSTKCSCEQLSLHCLFEFIFKKMRFKVLLQVKQLRGVKKALKLCFFMFIYFSIHHPLLCSWYLEKITFCCDCIITSWLEMFKQNPQLNAFCLPDCCHCSFVDQSAFIVISIDAGL